MVGKKSSYNTAGTAARHIFVSDARFQELLNDHVFPKQEDYDLAQVREYYIKWLRQKVTGRGSGLPGHSGGATLVLADERAKLASAQWQAAEIKNAVARGELVSIEKMGQFVEDDYYNLRERLLTMPGKLADTLAGLSRSEIEQLIKTELLEALSELHDPYSFGRRIIESGEGASEPSEDERA